MKNDETKQLTNKYDNPKRKCREKKTERITLRVTPEVKQKFLFLQKKCHYSQSDLFTCLVSDTKVNIIIEGTAIAKELAYANENLNILKDTLQTSNCQEAVNQLHQTKSSFDKVCTLLYEKLGGK